MRKKCSYLACSHFSPTCWENQYWDICYMSGYSGYTVIAKFVDRKSARGKEALAPEIREVKPFTFSGRCSFPSLSFLRHCFYGGVVGERKRFVRWITPWGGWFLLIIILLKTARLSKNIKLKLLVSKQEPIDQEPRKRNRFVRAVQFFRLP